MNNPLSAAVIGNLALDVGKKNVDLAKPDIASLQALVNRVAAAPAKETGGALALLWSVSKGFAEDKEISMGVNALQAAIFVHKTEEFLTELSQRYIPGNGYPMANERNQLKEDMKDLSHEAIFLAYSVALGRSPDVYGTIKYLKNERDSNANRDHYLPRDPDHFLLRLLRKRSISR